MGIPEHFPFFTTKKPTTKMACIASSFTGSVAALKATKIQAKSVSKVIKADIYPEFGTYPGGGESPIIPFGSEKNAEREVIHGRWAMLGVTGAWAAENGIAVADKFPGAVAPLAPEGSGYPSFWNVLIIE